MAETDYDWIEETEETTSLERTRNGRPRVFGREEAAGDSRIAWIAGGALAVTAGLWWFFTRDAKAANGNGGNGNGGNGNGGNGNGGNGGVIDLDDDDDVDDNGGGGSPTGDDPIFGEAEFPPSPAGVQWDELDRLATLAEDTTKMKGLRDYLMATAEWESDGVPSAWNNKGDSKPAMRLFCKSFNYGGRFKDNPWRPDQCIAQPYSEMTDPRSKRWAWSGGWFQMMTSTALATSDELGHNMDPARIFDPPFQVAFAADLVRDFKKGYGANTWGDVRAGWALPKWAKPSNTSEGKFKVIEKFKKALNRVGRGVDVNLWKKTFTAKHYPGFETVLRTLLEMEGRL